MTLVIEAGRIYRAKRPRCTATGQVNDRMVTWIDSVGSRLQYDSPSVGIGRHLPETSVEAFLAWAGSDVTDQTPEGGWSDWPVRGAVKDGAR